MKSNVVSLEDIKRKKAREAVNEITRNLGPALTSARPLVFPYNGEYWHLDKSDNCIRGAPKEEPWYLKVLNRIRFIWSFVLGVSLVDFVLEALLGTISYLPLAIFGITLSYFLVGKSWLKKHFFFV